MPNTSPQNDPRSPQPSETPRPAPGGVGTGTKDDPATKNEPPSQR